MSGKYWWALHTCKTCFELFPYKCSIFLKLPLIRICVCQWSLTFNCCGMAGIPGDKDGEDSFFFLQRSLWKESGFYLTSDVLGPTLEVLGWMFMTPWMLAGKEILHTTQGGEGVAIAGEKDCTNIWRVHCICPRWATLARNAFLSRIIHWFLHLHLGFPLLQSLVRRPPASYHSQRCSRATHSPAVRQLGRWGAWEATIRRRRRGGGLAPHCFQFTQRLPHFPPLCSPPPWFLDCWR